MNPRPLGYEPNELPDCSTPRQPTDRNTPCRCAQGSHRRQEPGTIQQQLHSGRFVIRQASTPRRTHDGRSRRLDRVPVLPCYFRRDIPQLFTGHGHGNGMRKVAIVRLGHQSRREARRQQADALDVGQPTHDRHSRRYRGTHNLILVEEGDGRIRSSSPTDEVRKDPRLQLRTPASHFQCGASAPGIAAHTSGTGRA